MVVLVVVVVAVASFCSCPVHVFAAAVVGVVALVEVVEDVFVQVLLSFLVCAL